MKSTESEREKKKVKESMCCSNKIYKAIPLFVFTLFAIHSFIHFCFMLTTRYFQFAKVVTRNNSEGLHGLWLCLFRKTRKEKINEIKQRRDSC